MKENVDFYDENHGLTPLKKCHFSTFEKLLFLYSQILSFSSKTLFLGSFCPKKVKEKFEIFNKNHGLTPLENYNFWPSKKLLFFYSEIVCFLSRTS